MSNPLGVYYAPGHGRDGDLAYIAGLNGFANRVFGGNGPDVMQVSRAYQAAPNALLALRNWVLDDDNFQQQERMQADPVGFGVANATAQIAMLERLERQASERGLPFPPRQQILLNALNEPTIWGDEQARRRANLDIYSVTFGTRIEAAGCGALLGCINPGHPAEWPPEWGWFAKTLAWLEQSQRSYLELHEYWQPEGPSCVWVDAQGNTRHDAGALAWRHKHLKANVRIIIGECGVDGVLHNRHAQRNTGWLAYPDIVPPNRYADQIVEYINGCDERVKAVWVFRTDYDANNADGESSPWATFDTAPAHDAILARLGQIKQQPVTVHLPIVTAPVSHEDLFERSMTFLRKWEGGFQNNPEDHGNWTGGRKGVGELKGTKFGISAASYPDLDIVNLTQEQADAIYRRDYWQRSGADKLQWPACLLIFDTAVLHGVGTALNWQKEVGTDAFVLAAKRLRRYTQLDNWSVFGAGWTNRVAALLEEIGKHRA